MPNIQDADILHVGIVRIRVVGEGDLITTLYGYDSVLSEELAPLTLTPTDSREKTVLANFKSQKTMVKLETRLINENMKVNSIILFVKPIYTGYPQ